MAPPPQPEGAAEAMVTRGRRARLRLSPEQRREQIVVAAGRVFEGRDPPGVTFEEIAAEAGVSRALVYNYFGDKGGLLAAVYRHALAQLDEEIRASLDSGERLQTRVRSLVDHYLAFASSHRGVWNFLGHVATTQHPALQSARRARFESLAQSFGGGARARLAVAGLVGMLEAALLDWTENLDLDADTVAMLLEQQAWAGLAGLAGLAGMATEVSAPITAVVAVTERVASPAT